MHSFSRWALSLLFIAAGIGHFLSPASYLRIMPPWVPWPLFMVMFSGIAEIAGGLGVTLAQTRRAAGWGLIALLIAVFPANIEAVRSGMVVGGRVVPAWALWARLPLQLLLVVWVYRVCLRRAP